MPSIRTIPFEYRDGGLYGPQFEVISLNAEQQDAFAAASDAIEDTIESADPDADTVRGTIHVSGSTARVTWKSAHGLDTLGTDDVAEYKTDD